MAEQLKINDGHYKKITLHTIKRMLKECNGEEVEFSVYESGKNPNHFMTAMMDVSVSNLDDMERVKNDFRKFSGHTKMSYAIWEDVEKEVFKSEYGNKYERYKGDIWISQIDLNLENQGVNIAVKRESDEDVQVLAYVRRKGNEWYNGSREPYTLNEIVWSVLKDNIGWREEYCRKLLGE